MKVELNFCFGVGLYGQWKKFTTHPPNYVPNHHFQRHKNTNFIFFLKSECLHLPLTNITGHFRNPKRLFKLSKFSKNRFYPRPPSTPTAAVVFLADSVSFFSRFFKKKVSNWSGKHTTSNKTAPKVFETSPFFSPSIIIYSPPLLENAKIFQKKSK